jgi:signal transduction histidine kinase
MEDDLTTDGRMIYFSKSPPQNIGGEDLGDQWENIESDHKKFHKLTRNTHGHDSIARRNENREDRVVTINDLIEDEKREINTIQTLIKKQSKSLERAKKILREKQLILQTELERKTSRFSNNEKFSIMGELSSKMAHDIRNPLNVIKVQVDLLKVRYSKQEDKIMLDSLGRMERAVNGINNQLEDILNFLKESPVRFENNSILKILNESLVNINKPDTVTIGLPTHDATVLCDGYKMQRVFTNMIQNSIQAMGNAGTISIQIFEQNNVIKIEIKDTGPGIPDELLPKIFEPLFTTKVAGTGLGLSICKKIIDDHNGFVSVKNNPTTFTITIPNSQQDR